MKFSGLLKTSLIDYPDKVASVLYVPGCNLRCPFCHNWRLVLEPKGPFLSEENALRILKSRKKFVDSIVITGGEPTMQSDIPTFLMKLKKMGFAIKMDTNGFFPDVLKKCLPFLDYVAMDIKTCPEQYVQLGAKDIKKFLRTIKILKQGSTNYEFRSTVVPSFVDEKCIPKMGELIKGAKRFVFQQFVPGDTMDKSFDSVKPYSSGTIAHYADIMKAYVDEIMLRI